MGESTCVAHPTRCTVHLIADLSCREAKCGAQYESWNTVMEVSAEDIFKQMHADESEDRTRML